MEIQLSLNRKCLRLGRPEFFFFLQFEIFTNMDPNVLYPDAGTLIAAIKVDIGLFGVAHAAKKTSAADEIYQNILTGTSGLMKYAVDHSDNNLVKLESSGFTVNKQKERLSH